jgi:hypothetical protein
MVALSEHHKGAAMAIWNAQRERIRPAAKARIKKAATEERITDETCCALACVSYASEAAYIEGDGLPAGWKFLEKCNTPSGYDAVALFHNKTKTLVILNRGTEWSEAEDILQNCSAILGGQDYGQIEDALAFMTKMWVAQVTKATEIKVVGHSLGGGLAEAQVFLGASAMRAEDVEPPRDIFGIGIASAGYKDAILDFAARRTLAVNPDKSDITHYVRKHDVTQSIGLDERIGSVTGVGSVFQASLRRKHGPKGGHRWEPFADTIHNHDCCAYFEQFAVLSNQHVLWRWRAQLYEVRAGNAPEPFPNGQVPPGDI